MFEFRINVRLNLASAEYYYESNIILTIEGAPYWIQTRYSSFNEMWYSIEERELYIINKIFNVTDFI